MAAVIAAQERALAGRRAGAASDRRPLGVGRSRPQNLRIPGPTPLPASVRRALAQPMIDHRGPEFARLLGEVLELIGPVFRTQHEVLIYPGSGTGGLEASVVNCLSPGDRVLAVTVGAFGDRYSRIAADFGLAVDTVRMPWGQAAEPETIERRLGTEAPYRAVLLTHNETSTGVTNDVGAIGAAIRRAQPDALFLVDAVSSMAGIPFEMDAWQVDVAVAGSQKAWMVPPGMTMIGVGPRAWAAAESARLPRHYWDFRGQRAAQAQGQTPYTPPITQLYALREALHLIHKEGLERVWARHHRVAAYARRRIAALGLTLAADPRHASDTVTAICAPTGVDPRRLLARLREEHGVVFARGQGAWARTAFRIGHLGHVRIRDIAAACDALERVLSAGYIEGAVNMHE